MVKVLVLLAVAYFVGGFSATGFTKMKSFIDHAKTTVGDITEAIKEIREERNERNSGSTGGDQKESERPEQ